MNFEINLTPLIEWFFLPDQKVMIKTNILRTKRAFKMKGVFLSFLKGFQLSK